MDETLAPCGLALFPLDLGQGTVQASIPSSFKDTARVQALESLTTPRLMARWLVRISRPVPFDLSRLKYRPSR